MRLHSRFQPGQTFERGGYTPVELVQLRDTHLKIAAARRVSVEFDVYGSEGELAEFDRLDGARHV